MKAWRIEYRVPETWQHDTALVLATTAQNAIKKLRLTKHIGGSRVVSVSHIYFDYIIK
jgi:hypothetical protein